MDTKGLQKEFISWCKANKKSPKSELETKLLFVSFMKEKHPEEYKAAMENQKKQQLQQAQKAAHGAKLQYFRSLKNQCPEGEELVYYKKGGSVTCGCKKKEQGGEIPTAKCGSAVEKFKARKAMKGDTLSRIADATGSLGGFKNAQKAKEASKKEDKKKDFENKWKKNQVVVGKDLKKGNNNVTKKEREDVTKDKCGSKIKKHQEGSVIAQFKAYRQGGSLNGIPFYLGGTPKGGLPISQSAKERYKGARGRMYGKDNVNILEIENTDTNAKIKLAIVGNDSTITETPPHSWYITPKNRISDNYAPGGDKKYLDKDWPIMRRRWEEAKKVMSKKPYYAGPLYGTYPLPK